MAREIEYASVVPLSVETTTPAFEAYSKFREEFETTANCAIKNSFGDKESGKVGTLSQSSVDKMSVVWLAEKYQDLGRDITRADIENGATSRFDKLMAERAMQQFDTIKHAKFNHEGGFLLIGSREKDVLTGKDIDKTLRSIEDQRRSMDMVAPLFANNGELFNKLAEDHNGKWSINYWDLKDARRADDRAKAKGDSLYTAEERAVIDNLYKKWGSADMRRVEHRGQGDTMGCDGVLNFDTVAKGTGFDSPEEVFVAANEMNAHAIKETEEVCFGENLNMEDLQKAVQMQRDAKAQIEAASKYTVKPGQGFDRIARDVLTTENGASPQEASVVEYSSQIAGLNGYNRESYDPRVRSLQPGDVVKVHDDEWKLNRHLDATIEVQQFLNDTVNSRLELRNQ